MHAVAAGADREAELEGGLRYPGAEAPFYVPVGDEVALFEAAHLDGTAVMLKGPTGCGKTRFVEYMAWRLGRPLVTVACHDDLSASDLTGRYLIRGGETVWQDGALTLAVRHGALCYLDELVESRQDVVVVITRSPTIGECSRSRSMARSSRRRLASSSWRRTTPATSMPSRS